MRSTITHVTLTGHRVELEDPKPDVVAFLERLEGLVADPCATEADAIALAYSRENPILDHSIFPARGAVTPAVLADPAYRIVTDLLFRKRVAQDQVDVDKLAEEYTLSVPDAAARLGVHENAVRQAIAAQRLPSWMKGGRHYLHPRSVDAFRIAPRGVRGQEERRAREEAAEAAAIDTALVVVAGHVKGMALSIKPLFDTAFREKLGPGMVKGRIVDWQQIAVLTSGGKSARLFILEPDPKGKPEEILWGSFSVRGRFRIVDHANNARAARERFEDWKPGPSTNAQVEP